MRNDAEHKLQCAVVQHLKLTAAAGVLWFAIPNGEYRSERTGARLKAEGVLPGAPDLCLIIGGRAFGLELKAKGGRQSDVQRAVEIAWFVAGGEYRLAKGIDEALATLKGWGALRSSGPVTIARAA